MPKNLAARLYEPMTLTFVLARFVEQATDSDYADSKLPSRWFRNWIDLFELRAQAER
jgi:hypothetical protein